MPDKLNEKLSKIIRKVKAHADRGEGNEKRNAQELLEKLLSSHNLKIEDLDSIEKSECTIPYKDAREQRLFIQIICVNLNVGQVAFNRKQKLLYFEATKSEFIDIKNECDYYKKILNKELKALKMQIKLLAESLCHKYDLTRSSASKRDNENKLTEEELKAIRKNYFNFSDSKYKKGFVELFSIASCSVSNKWRELSED